MIPFRLLPSLLWLFSASISAQNSNPLDFGYEVIGPPQFRPTAVFNDGKDTFIQTRSDNDLDIKSLSGVERRGIYLVVPGLPERVNFRLAVGESIEVRRQRPEKPGSVLTSNKQVPLIQTPGNAHTPKFPRLAFIGPKPDLKSQVLTSGEGVPLQLAYSGMKPESYTLVMDVPKDLDKRPTDWDLPRQEMSWTDAIELLAEASNTYVEVNGGSKLVRVTATPALSHRKTAEAAGITTPAQQNLRDVASTALLPVATPTLMQTSITTSIPVVVAEKASQPQQPLPSPVAAIEADSVRPSTLTLNPGSVPIGQTQSSAAHENVTNDILRLQLEPNAFLHIVLDKFGKDNGTSIQWAHSDRIRISTSRLIRGSSVRNVLEQTLNLFELTAVYDKGTNTYYVR
jgi:hypothetical protein